MNKNIPIALALTSAVIVGGCSRKADKLPVQSETPSGASTSPAAATANERDQALVRVVNALPGTPAVEVTADKVAIATDVPFGSVTPYEPVAASADDFAVTVGGQEHGAVLAENTEPIRSGNRYTLVVFPGNDSDKADTQVVTDDIVPPDPGKARLRMIHAAPDVESVNVHARGGQDAIFNGVDFRETTSYANVDPTMTKLELRSADGKRVVARPGVSLEPGKSYTIVVAGRARGAPPLKALLIEDRLVGQTPTE